MLTKSVRSLLFAWLMINAICGNAQADIDALCPAGYQYINGKCYSSSVCPEGHYLNTDGKCYPQTNKKCPPGYFLNTDELCYRTNPEPCPFETTTTTTEPTTTSTTELTTTTTTTEPTTTTTTEPTTTTTTTEPTTTTTTTEPTTTTTTTTEATTTTTTTTTEPTTTTTTTTTEPTTTTTTTTTEPTTSTTTTTEPTTTTTTMEPIPYPPPVVEELTRCPPGSIFYESQCRKIVCSEGEYYAGRCISSACPPGTVWYGKRCQEPGYITTILEIANVIHNEHKYSVTSENINRVEYVTAAPYDPDTDKSYDFSTPAPPITTTRRPWIYPSLRPTTEQSVVDEPFPDRNPGPGCCFLKSPRICINYAPNWVCSSKEKKLCDPRVCTAPVVYLKPPKIVYDENTKRVVMPPNPPLLACSTSECKESEVLDCSGCKDHQRDKCSPSCYSYYCPNGTCAFMNTEDFCALYPGEFGCNAMDGCIWDWCSKKCY